MSTTREVPCQLDLNFDTPVAPSSRRSEQVSNVVQVFFGSKTNLPAAKHEIDHQAIVKQVLQNAKMLSW